MVESAAQTRSIPQSVFHVRPTSARSVLRLKRWQSGRRETPLVLGGCVLPEVVGTETEGVPRFLCTGPQEWLMVYAPNGLDRLRTILAPELEAQGLALVDLTEGLSVLEVSGTGVRDVVAQGCGLDLDLKQFGVRQCARTRFAQIAVVVDCIQESGTFELYVPRSYAAYLKAWLLDAALGLGEPSR